MDLEDREKSSGPLTCKNNITVVNRQSPAMKAAEKTDNNREMPRATVTCTRGVS